MMINSLANPTDFRLLLPETIWLEPEHFEQATEISNQVTGEEQFSWQVYLNTLALLGFEEWLKGGMPQQKVHRQFNFLEPVAHLQVGEFKLNLIASENLLDEMVNIPQDAIAQTELAAHFYVVLEVLEEQEELIIRGFLSRNQLVNYLERVNLQSSEDGCYQLPLSLFDLEPNHLVFSCLYLEATAIPLPAVAQTENTLEQLQANVQETRTKLSQCGQTESADFPIS